MSFVKPLVMIISFDIFKNREANLPMEGWRGCAGKESPALGRGLGAGGVVLIL